MKNFSQIVTVLFVSLIAKHSVVCAPQFTSREGRTALSFRSDGVDAPDDNVDHIGESGKLFQRFHTQGSSSTTGRRQIVISLPDSDESDISSRNDISRSIDNSHSIFDSEELQSIRRPSNSIQRDPAIKVFRVPAEGQRKPSRKPQLFIATFDQSSLTPALTHPVASPTVTVVPVHVPMPFGMPSAKPQIDIGQKFNPDAPSDTQSSSSNLVNHSTLRSRGEERDHLAEIIASGATLPRAPWQQPALVNSPTPRPLFPAFAAMLGRWIKPILQNIARS